MAIERFLSTALITVLAFVIIDDLRNYRIKNSVVVILFCLCIADLLAKANFRQFIAHFLFAAAAFGLLMIAFQRGLLGGGDTKLLAVALLGIGPELSLVYAIVLLLLTLAYWGGAKLGLFPSQMIEGRLKVPFGPEIAGAWIAILVMSTAL